MIDIHAFLNMTEPYGYLVVTIVGFFLAQLLIIIVRTLVGTNTIISKQNETNRLLREVNDTLYIILQSKADNVSIIYKNKTDN